VLPERVGSHGITVPAGAAARGYDYDQHTAQLDRIYRVVRRS